MVMCGEQQPESDHFVEMENSVIGSEQGTPWRETRGWFAYKMKSKGKPVNAVRIESFSDAARDADVYVNGSEDRFCSREKYVTYIVIAERIVESFRMGSEDYAWKI